MEKERKTIKCSYAVLVIILCAAVAILTDYIVIDRKMNKCNCPKCEVNENNEVKDESAVIDESSNENDNFKSDDFKFTYTSISGKYYKVNDTENYISFNSDGTWEGKFNFCTFYHDLSGKYTIEGDKISLIADEKYKRYWDREDDDLTSSISIIYGDGNYPHLIKAKGLIQGCSPTSYYYTSRDIKDFIDQQ